MLQDDWLPELGQVSVFSSVKWGQDQDGIGGQHRGASVVRVGSTFPGQVYDSGAMKTWDRTHCKSINKIVQN